VVRSTTLGFSCRPFRIFYRLMNHRMIANCIQQIRSYVESADYAGYDPYDALNSPLISCLGTASKWVRMGATQLLRRCPVNFRPLLGIRKGHNPKGLGLFLEGYVCLHAMWPHAECVSAINRLLGLIESNRSPGYENFCWGYNFPWQSRLVYRSAYAPTIVNTAFIGHALVDAYEALGRSVALDMAVSAVQFMLRDLHRRQDGDTYCFSYSPRVDDFVHNANALGASLIFRISRIVKNPGWRDAACRSMRYTVNRQRPDGAWYFAEDSRTWVDSYHTGYVLESLRRFLEAGEDNTWRDSYRRGVESYARTLFLDDGTPKHYQDRTYPIDIHSAAEGVYFFAGEGWAYRRLTERILQWMLEHLWDKRGYFYYRKSYVMRNKIPYMRWSQAWGFRALARYLVATHEWSRAVS